MHRKNEEHIITVNSNYVWSLYHKRLHFVLTFYIISANFHFFESMYYFIIRKKLDTEVNFNTIIKLSQNI
jgi:hypothetical protein